MGLQYCCSYAIVGESGFLHGLYGYYWYILATIGLFVCVIDEEVRKVE